MFYSKNLFPLLLVLLSFSLFTACDDDSVDPVDPLEGLNGAVFTLSNDFDNNEVVFYSREDDGALRLVGSYATGGQGFNINETDSPAFNDPLGTQGALALTPDNRYLVAVNAGSNSVTSFRVTAEGLERVSTLSSGGEVPVAITATNDHVYVVNNGGTGAVTAYRLDDGELETLSDGTVTLGREEGLGAGTVLVSPDGEHLLVTTKPDSKLILFDVNNDGEIREFEEFDAAGATPFGSAWLNDNVLLTTEAFMGNMGEGAISSYRIDGGAPTAISASVPTSQTASCWTVISPDNRYAYTSNTPDGSITAFGLAADGTLTSTTSSGVSGSVPNPMGSFVLDMAVAGDNLLYVVANTNSQIVPFRIEGSELVRLDEQIITDTNLLQEGRVTGLVAF